MKDLIKVTTQTPIEVALGIDEKGMTTARKLYEFLELDKSHYSRWYKQNITDNEFAVENEDYFSFAINGECGGQASKDAKLTSDFAKKLSMTAKNEKGEEARNYFVAVENKAKQTAIEMNNLSPELRFLINVEMQQKEQQKQIDDVKSDLQGIRDTILLSPSTWRTDTSKMITRIAQKLGGNEYIQTVREESYKLLEERAHVALSIRLSNIRKTMAENGVCKSKRDKLNKVDVIERDPKVLECYLAIVKEMAIKYGVS